MVFWSVRWKCVGLKDMWDTWGLGEEGVGDGVCGEGGRGEGRTIPGTGMSRWSGKPSARSLTDPIDFAYEAESTIG